MKAVAFFATLVGADMYSKVELQQAFQDAECCSQTRAVEAAEYCMPILGGNVVRRSTLLDLYKENCCGDQCQVEFDDCPLCNVDPSEIGLGSNHTRTVTNPATGYTRQIEVVSVDDDFELSTGATIVITNTYYEEDDGTVTQLTKGEPTSSILATIVGKPDLTFTTDAVVKGYVYGTCPYTQTTERILYVRYNNVDKDFLHEGQTLAETGVALVSPLQPEYKYEILDELNVKGTSIERVEC